MKITFVERTTCRLCGSADLRMVLQLASTPVGDFFIPAARLREKQDTVPLDLMLCGACGQVQLRNVVDPEAVYRDYTYVSSVSLELPEHFRKYAAEMIELTRPKQGSLVVELGSNEGVLLSLFKTQGFRVLGLDPASAIAKAATGRGIETLDSFFTGAIARKLKEERGTADIIIANNVFANIDDDKDAADGIRELLSPGGVFVFETSYLLDVAQKGLMDTIFHEHLSYLAVKPLDAFFRNNGLELIDARRVSTKGGSLRGIVQLRGGPRKVSPSVRTMIAAEDNALINTPEVFRHASTAWQKARAELDRLLGGIKAEGGTIAGYGAAVGLTTMIYYFGLNRFLDFIVDDNETKHNKFSPGYHIPVFPSSAIYDRKPDCVLLLAWRYAGAILDKHDRFRKQGGKFILPMPRVEVIG